MAVEHLSQHTETITFTPNWQTSMAEKQLPRAEWYYGRHPVADLIRSGKPVEKVFIQKGLRGEVEVEIRNLCKKHDIPMQVIPREKLNKLMPGRNHQGVAAQGSLIHYQRIQDVLPMIMETGETPLVLMADRITDVGNFGAVARSAECMGVHALIIPEKDSARIHDDAMKASAGALANLHICRESSLVNALEYLRESGLYTIALALLPQAVPLHDIDLTAPLCLILGAEDTGVQPALLKRADAIAYIKQVGSTQSLNVSVAAGISLYETIRQRSS